MKHCKLKFKKHQDPDVIREAIKFADSKISKGLWNHEDAYTYLKKKFDEQFPKHKGIQLIGTFPK